MNAGEDGPTGEVAPPESDSALTRKRTRQPAPAPGHQRMRDLLSERAHLLQPSAEFYAQVLARTSGREPSTGPVLAPTYAAERAAPASTPPTNVPVKDPAPQAEKAEKAEKAQKPEKTGPEASDQAARRVSSFSSIGIGSSKAF